RGRTLVEARALIAWRQELGLLIELDRAAVFDGGADAARTAKGLLREFGTRAVDGGIGRCAEAALSFFECRGELLKLIIIAELNRHMREALPSDASGIVCLRAFAALVENPKKSRAAMIPISVQVEQDGVVVVVDSAELLRILRRLDPCEIHLMRLREALNEQRHIDRTHPRRTSFGRRRFVAANHPSLFLGTLEESFQRFDHHPRGLAEVAIVEIRISNRRVFGRRLLVALGPTKRVRKVKMKFVGLEVIGIADEVGAIPIGRPLVIRLGVETLGDVLELDAFAA